MIAHITILHIRIYEG